VISTPGEVKFTSKGRLGKGRQGNSCMHYAPVTSVIMLDVLAHAADPKRPIPNLLAKMLSSQLDQPKDHTSPGRDNV
jgi:hypothetical protein